MIVIGTVVAAAVFAAATLQPANFDPLIRIRMFIPQDGVQTHEISGFACGARIGDRHTIAAKRRNLLMFTDQNHDDFSDVVAPSTPLGSTA